jgi:rhomboid protease GluP
MNIMNWKNLFDNLGMNGTKWQWRIMRWGRNWQALRHGQPLQSDFSLTHLLIGINIFLFVAMIIQGLLTNRGINVVFSPDVHLLQLAGGQVWPRVLQYGEWWRCITYAYTHGGLIHLGFNMMVLYQVGPMLEREIGLSRFFTLYTLTALTATGLGYIWHPNITVIGASGSLFGLIGFSITYFHRMGPAGKTIRDFMLKWAAFAFIFGFMVGADNAGHLGGGLGGAAIGALLPLGIRGRQSSARLFNSLAVICLLATVLSLLALLVFWFRVWTS